MRSQEAKTISIVVPVYNEEDNVSLMVEEIATVMESLPVQWELIVVDDGSRDQTVPHLKQIAETNERLKLVLLRRNYGQTAAMHAGIQEATGDFIATLDGDLQNDPRDIPMMLAKLSEGFDLVHGWRRHRQDALLNRKLPSRVANWIISRSTGFPIHDLGCTLKVMRRDIAQELELFGDMHRFIPILAHRQGAKCVEVETHHRPRQFGKTKYGIGRTTRVILDLLTILFLLKYFDSPMKLFGKIGMWVGGFATFALGISVVQVVSGGPSLIGNVWSLLSVLSVFLSLQFFCMGLLGEIAMRVYYAIQSHQNYQIRECVNFDLSHPVIGMHSVRRAG